MDLDSLIDLVVPAFENVALCTQVGESESWPDSADLKKLARKICFICPLFVECRTTNDRFEIRGVETDERDFAGIFAGEDLYERRARRKAERNNKPASQGYASQCRACGRLVLDQNAVRLYKGNRLNYACAHCLEKNSQDKDVES
jgi:hypothetical protein